MYPSQIPPPFTPSSSVCIYCPCFSVARICALQRPSLVFYQICCSRATSFVGGGGQDSAPRQGHRLHQGSFMFNPCERCSPWPQPCWLTGFSSWICHSVSQNRFSSNPSTSLPLVFTSQTLSTKARNPQIFDPAYPKPSASWTRKRDPGGCAVQGPPSHYGLQKSQPQSGNVKGKLRRHCRTCVQSSSL